MVHRRKLEEEIARAKDPQIRKQLQELLDERNRRWNETKRKGSNLYKELTKPSSNPKIGMAICKGFAFLGIGLSIIVAVTCMQYFEWWLSLLLAFPLFLFGLVFAIVAYSDDEKKTKKQRETVEKNKEKCNSSNNHNIPGAWAWVQNVYDSKGVSRNMNKTASEKEKLDSSGRFL